MWKCAALLAALSLATAADTGGETWKSVGFLNIPASAEVGAM